MVHDYEGLREDDWFDSEGSATYCGVALGMGSVDSAYLYRTAPSEIRSYTHPEYAPMMVFLQYFKQVEVSATTQRG
jgi:hypothetical protein